MKAILFFLVLLLISAGNITRSQGVPPIQWQKTFGGNNNDWTSSSCQTQDGGFILQGTTYSTNGDATGNHGNYDVLVIKTDASGNVQWKKMYGGAGTDIGGNIINTADGGYLFGASSSSVDGDVSGNHGGSDFWIVKLDPSGNIQWQKCYGGTNADNLFTVKQNSDGGYMAVGNTTSGNGDLTVNYGSNDAWVIKISSTGTLLWQKSYGGTGQDLPTDIIEMTGGDLVFCGGTYSSNGNLSVNYGDKDGWLMRISGTDGSAIWSQTYGGSQYDDITGLLMTDDAVISIAAAGSTMSNDYNITGNHGSTDMLLLTIDGSAGVLNSARCYGGSNYEYAYNIASCYDRGYFISGITGSSDGDVSGNRGVTDIWALKLNIGGGIDWQKCLGGSSQERCFHGMETADGGYFVSGGSNSNDADVSGNKGGEDLWVVKLSPCFTPPVFTATITTSSNACGTAVSMAVPGGIPYTYQWKKNGLNIAGATARNYTANTKGTYSCVVKNGACGTTGSPNSIYNFPQSAAITPAGVVNKCAADPINFSANTGSDLVYQWYRGTTVIAGATGSTYTTKKAGKYKVLVSNTLSGCSKMSPVTTVTNTCFASATGETAAALNTGEIYLLTNAPNPFTTTTNISYTVPANFTTAQIIITDGVGKVIRQYPVSKAGIGTIHFEGQGLSAGIYIAMLVVDHRTVATTKMAAVTPY